MEMQWYGFCIVCPKCQGQTRFLATLYSADGELMFVFHCPKCEEPVHLLIYGSELQRMALIRDMEGKQEPSIVPKLLLATVEIKKKDTDFLRSLGIGRNN